MENIIRLNYGDGVMTLNIDVALEEMPMMNLRKWMKLANQHSAISDRDKFKTRLYAKMTELKMERRNNQYEMEKYREFRSKGRVYASGGGIKLNACERYDKLLVRELNHLEKIEEMFRNVWTL